MKITRKQLRKIIAESLMIEARVNLRSIGKKLEKWNGSVGQKRDNLEKDLLASLDDLATAYDAGEFDKNLKRKEAAKELKSTLEKLFQNPNPLPPEREKKEALKAVKAVEEAPEEADSTSTTTSSASSQDKNKWNPDPNPNSGWEYQLRDCFWYARPKGKTKEYKLGKADGTELMKASFIDSIVRLNKKYKDLVTDCDPIFEKPNEPNKPNKPNKPDKPDSDPDQDQPSPSPGPSQTVEVKFVRPKGGVAGLRELVRNELIYDFIRYKKDSSYKSTKRDAGDPYNAARPDLFGIKDVRFSMYAKAVFKAKQKDSRELRDTRMIENLIRQLKGKETARSGKIVDVLPKVIYYTFSEGANGVMGFGHSFIFVVTTEETLKTEDKLMIYQFQVGANGNVVGALQEGKSRGQLYRERYHGRY